MAEVVGTDGLAGRREETVREETVREELVREESGRETLRHETGRDPGPARHGMASGVHRFLGGFPTAFFTLALITDIEYLRTANLMWQYFSIWLIVAALITGGLTVLAGIVDLASRRGGKSGRGGRAGTFWQFGLTFLALLIGLWNAFVHSGDGWTAIAGLGIVLSIVTVILIYGGVLIRALVDRSSHVARSDQSNRGEPADQVEYAS